MKFERLIEQKIWQAVDGNLSGVTPGLCLQVVHRGRLIADIKMGRTWRYYDLASLTKIIFTVPMFMQLAEAHNTGRRAEPRIDLTASVQRYLPDWPHKSQTVREVLSHSAGLASWAPFYKKMRARQFAGENERRAFIKKLLFQIPTGSKRRAVYSDLDFILLGFLLEDLYDRSLIEIWQNRVPWRQKTPSLHFNPIDIRGRCDKRFSRGQYAPTERCPWRKKILQGEVHDDNTWSFGGVSTHAGLFGTPDDVTTFGKMLRASWRGQSAAKFPSTAIVRKFTRRAISKNVGDWSLGFMLPTEGKASCGRYYSATAFGHTGFTGTSLWYDPKRDLLITILSNRVHPTRLNRAFISLRPKIHEIVVESVD